MTLLPHMDRVTALRSGHFPAPVMVDVTPVDGICNLSCVWCCQAHSRNSRSPRFMERKTIDRLGPWCSEWGVKAWRVSGEADPTLHPQICAIIDSGVDAGMDVGLITNGVHLDKVENAERLSFVGVSLDAATQATWSAYKGGKPGDFERIIANVTSLREHCPDLDISLKFLIVDETSLTDAEFSAIAVPDHRARAPIASNRHEVEAVARLAERLKVKLIVKNAYSRDSKPDFARCLATPLGGVFDAYHTFHLCCDARGRYVLTDDYTRDDWSALRELWGGERHRELIASIKPSECAGCAKIAMNRELEKHFSDYQTNFI